ncbi:MAG: stage II sporulation protein R [Bacillota bacterium]|nr:stage II sporulation protein R [Bacillota bacterium]
MKKLSDEKKCVIALTLVIIMGFLLFFTYAGAAENEHDGIVRLHVVANSNSAGDQGLKLKVRDAVIEYMSRQEELNSIEDMRAFLESDKSRITRIADGIIAAEGCDYSADVSMGIRYIPEKAYGDITFPAGNYEALTITLGEGRGENWWCVLFPPLCLLDEGTETTDSASAQTDDSAQEHQSGGDCELTQEQQLQLRWKIIELLNED